jgi:hypothetical protein
MSKLTNIILHCSDSLWGSASEIDKWHKERGWSGIGYHYVILNGKIRPNFYLDSLNGSIEVGRYFDGDNWLSKNETGAHALGYNDKSIGICLIGIKSFTYAQLESLDKICLELMDRFDIPIRNVLGHYETEKAKGKTCPNFPVNDFRKYLSVGAVDMSKHFK